VLIGEEAEPLAERLGPFGVSLVYGVRHALLGAYAPEAWGRCLTQLIESLSPEIVMAAGSERGQEVMASSGCLGCHKVGENGNTLGPNLTHIGDKLGKDAIARTLVNPTPPMPSYGTFQKENPKQFDQLVQYVASLKSE